MLSLLPSTVRPRAVLFVVGSLASAACSLTEEVRTRPGGPGDISFGDGGSGGRHYQTDRDSGADARDRDGNADGATTGGSGGRGGGGAGGRLDGGGGISFDAGPQPPDGAVEQRSCPVDISFNCYSYCGALSDAVECQYQLRKAAGVREDGGVDLPDGSVPHQLTESEMILRCSCNCERHYRTETCGLYFDQLLFCAQRPLTIHCATDLDLRDELPSVEGPCGPARSKFVQCFETPPPPPPPIPDGGS